jgi:hypothetical protein
MFDHYLNDFGQVPVAHACNPSFSIGRDQEDRSLKPAHAEFKRPYLKKIPSQKRAGRVSDSSG